MWLPGFANFTSVVRRTRGGTWKESAKLPCVSGDTRPATCACGEQRGHHSAHMALAIRALCMVLNLVAWLFLFTRPPPHLSDAHHRQLLQYFGRSIFLTVQTNCLSFFYFALGVVAHLSGSARLEDLFLRLFPLAFALGALLTPLYYGLDHFNPERRKRVKLHLKWGYRWVRVADHVEHGMFWQVLRWEAVEKHEAEIRAPHSVRGAISAVLAMLRMRPRKAPASAPTGRDRRWTLEQRKKEIEKGATPWGVMEALPKLHGFLTKKSSAPVVTEAAEAALAGKSAQKWNQ